jgi:hypothetical protein
MRDGPERPVRDKNVTNYTPRNGNHRIRSQPHDLVF